MKKGYFSYSSHETFLVQLHFGNFANIVKECGDNVLLVEEKIKEEYEKSLNELNTHLYKMQNMKFWVDFIESGTIEINWRELAEDAINNYKEINNEN